MAPRGSNPPPTRHRPAAPKGPPPSARVAAPNWVTFESLNALRFPFNPVPDNQLRRWCREQKVPSRKFPDGWRIDLTSFDRIFSVCFDGEPEAPTGPDDPDHAVVAELANQLGLSS